MHSNLIEKTEKELIWEKNCGAGLVWIERGVFSFVIIVAVTQSMLWYLSVIPLWILHIWISKHYLKPRMGEAKLRIKTKPANLIYGTVWGLLIALVVVMVSMWMMTVPRITNWVAFWLGLCIAFLVSNWMWVAYSTWDGKSTYPLWERVLLLIYLLLMFWLEPNLQTMSLILGSFGIFNISYGLVTLIGFIRRNPVLPNE